MMTGPPTGQSPTAVGGWLVGLRMTDFSFLCTFVPGSEKSTDKMELSFRGRSLELSLRWNFHSSGTNVPRIFAPWNIRSRGTFAPQERMFQELSFPVTFVPVQLSFLHNFLSKHQKQFKAVAIHLAVAYVH